MPCLSVLAIQATTKFLWTSMPQQILYGARIPFPEKKSEVLSEEMQCIRIQDGGEISPDFLPNYLAVQKAM